MFSFFQRQKTDSWQIRCLRRNHLVDLEVRRISVGNRAKRWISHLRCGYQDRFSNGIISFEYKIHIYIYICLYIEIHSIYSIYIWQWLCGWYCWCNHWHAVNSRRIEPILKNGERDKIDTLFARVSSSCCMCSCTAQRDMDGLTKHWQSKSTNLGDV